MHYWDEPSLLAAHYHSHLLLSLELSMQLQIGWHVNSNSVFTSTTHLASKIIFDIQVRLTLEHCVFSVYCVLQSHSCSLVPMEASVSIVSSSVSRHLSLQIQYTLYIMCSPNTALPITSELTILCVTQLFFITHTCTLLMQIFLIIYYVHVNGMESDITQTKILFIKKILFSTFRQVYILFIQLNP